MCPLYLLVNKDPQQGLCKIFSGHYLPKLHRGLCVPTTQISILRTCPYSNNISSDCDNCRYSWWPPALISDSLLLVAFKNSTKLQHLCRLILMLTSYPSLYFVMGPSCKKIVPNIQIHCLWGDEGFFICVISLYLSPRGFIS